MYGNYMMIYLSGCLVALFCIIHLTRIHDINKINIFIGSIVAVLLSWITPIILLSLYIIYKIQYNKWQY